eukprot:8274728-Prorocentrum_lima.AAC.1
MFSLQSPPPRASAPQHAEANGAAYASLSIVQTPKNVRRQLVPRALQRPRVLCCYVSAATGSSTVAT